MRAVFPELNSRESEIMSQNCYFFVSAVKIWTKTWSILFDLPFEAKKPFQRLNYSMISFYLTRQSKFPPKNENERKMELLVLDLELPSVKGIIRNN